MRDKTRQTLQTDYGFAPQAFQDAVQSTLDTIKEEQPMKRFTVRTALIAALVLALMAGMALAIAGELGVLGVIEKTIPLPKEAKEQIQTRFTQSGGDAPDITLRVRDAVSDGKTLFVAVEAKAKNPDDVLLTQMDASDLLDSRTIYDMTPPGSAARPDFSAIRGDQRVLTLAPHNIKILPEAEGEAPQLVFGYSWRYEGTDTVVIHLFIALDRLSDPRETLVIRFNPALHALSRAESTATNLNGPQLETSPLIVEVNAGKMEARRAVAKVPFDFMGIRVDAMEVVTTPLATYVTVNKTALEEQNKRLLPSLPFFVCDAEGIRYEDLVRTRTFSQELTPDSWEGVPSEFIYERRGDLPASIVLIPREMYGLSPDARPWDSLVVPLTEVTDGSE